jgi:beta-lactamase regulating signal transducer with metallopeptidase domain
MSSLTFAFLWCLVQVTIVSVGALIVIRITLRKKPELAATTAAWATGIALISTLLVPIELPGWMVPVAFSDAGAADVNSQNAALTPNEVSQPADLPKAASPAGIRFDLRSLLRKSDALKNADLPVGRILAQSLVIGLSLGVIGYLGRLLLGLILLRSLLRRADVIRDQKLAAVVDSLLVKSGYSRRIVVAESSEIECAAVVGFIRPMVILAKQWTTWSPAELQSILAHELAHICRRDVWWRLVGHVSLACYFYHPLLRWLTERLILAQELAADQLAIRMTGESRTYLRSLAQLAIRHAAEPGLRHQPLLTPVFSGHLMWRIEMLQAMDCEQIRTPRLWRSWFVIVTLVLFGLTTTLVRCVAQSAAPDKTPNSTSTNAVNLTDTEVPSPSKTDVNWFSREKMPASLPVFGKKGGVHLNIAALRQTPLWACIQSVLVSETFGAELTKDWNFQLLDSISLDATMAVTIVLPKDLKADKNSVSFGMTRLQLRLNRDVDWRAAIQSQYPKSVAGKLNDREYLELNLPDLGPLPLRVHAISARELAGWIGFPIVSIAAADIDRWYIPLSKQSNPTWSEEWNAVSGGVLALVLIPSGFDKHPPLDGRDSTEQFKIISQGIETYSIGIDLSPDGMAAEAKIRMRCKPAGDVQKTLAAAQKLLTQFKAECEVEAKKDNDPLNCWY